MVNDIMRHDVLVIDENLKNDIMSIKLVNPVQETTRQPNTEPIESTLETFRHEEINKIHPG